MQQHDPESALNCDCCSVSILQMKYASKERKIKHLDSTHDEKA